MIFPQQGSYSGSILVAWGHHDDMHIKFPQPYKFKHSRQQRPCFSPLKSCHFLSPAIYICRVHPSRPLALIFKLGTPPPKPSSAPSFRPWQLTRLAMLRPHLGVGVCTTHSITLQEFQSLQLPLPGPPPRLPHPLRPC
jgi:hypothetical protein